MSLAIPAEELERSKVHIQFSHSGGNPVFRLEPLPSTSFATGHNPDFNVNFEVSQEEAGYKLVVYPTPTRKSPSLRHDAQRHECPSRHSFHQPLLRPAQTHVPHTMPPNAGTFAVNDPLTGEATFAAHNTAATDDSNTSQSSYRTMQDFVGLSNDMENFDQVDMSSIFHDVLCSSNPPNALYPSPDSDLYSPGPNSAYDHVQDSSADFSFPPPDGFSFPPSDGFSLGQVFAGTRRSSITGSETLSSVSDQLPSASCLPSPAPSIPSSSPRLSPPLFTTAPEIPLGPKVKAASQEEKSTSKGLRRAGKRQYPCLHPTCTRFFTSEYTRQMHMSSHDTKARKTYPCSMSEETGCMETFSRAHDRLRHEVAMHGKDCEWVCQRCGRFFSSSRMLEAHKCPGNVSGWVKSRHSPGTAIGV
ncbi:hypothetical protein OE88DRAFT_1645614 [Heliocybe sulcata]|uniref:C2H2-type domain-containing protein n=1 Tax=Heliocybe sulcata TaxID=5364 RepID=A0A5C3N0M4_9AGAM|nr:hypothetical protein OE88DRAFT_1645614 [Heliocybe sulcata]